MNRRQAGSERLAALQGPGAVEELLALDRIVTGFGSWVLDAVFGDVYNRPGLSLRDRQLINFAVLVACGG